MATNQEIEAEAAKPMVWFQHDVNAAYDMKLELVIDEFGMAGYGRWWRLCELLAAETGHKVEVGDERKAKIMARKLSTNVGDLLKYLRFLSDIELICMPGDGFIWNERMINQARTTGEKRANGKRGGRPRKTAVKT